VEHFVEREEVLDDMKQHFESSENPSKPPVYVLQGLGGCGKSQLALKYCQKTRDEHPAWHVLWIDATSTTTARQSIATIVQIMSPGINTADNDANLRHFKQTIHTSGASEQRWLLVFDNYDDPKNFSTKILKNFFPQTTHGSIVVTTRVAGMSRLGQFRGVSTMTEAEALELLFRSIKSENSNTDVEEGTKIVKRLGFHALAIDQAGAYIRSRELELCCFLDHYTKRREKVLKEIPQDWVYFGKLKDNSDAEIELSVFTTWELSLDQISGNEAAQNDKKHVLTLSGFLNNTEIKDVYFQAYASKNVTWLPTCRKDTDWDIHEFEDILKELQNLSLLERLVVKLTGASYSLHPLIQDWIKLRITFELRKEYGIEVNLLLSSFISSARDHIGEFTKLSFEENQILLAHVNTVLSNRQEYQFDVSVLEDENSLKAMREFEALLYSQGHYSQAEELCRHVLDFQKRSLRAAHPNTIISLADLALYLGAQAKYYEAESLHREAISLTKELKDEGGLQLQRMTNNYASLLLKQKRYDEVERLLQSILPKAERALGGNHLDILRGKSRLAETLRGQERYEEAETLSREVLIMEKSTLGEEHPDTLSGFNNLALVLEAQGKTKEAGNLYQECLWVQEKVRGKLHPETLQMVHNMGRLYWINDKLIESESFLGRAFEGRRIVLGWNHPDTLKSLLEVGVVLYKKGNVSAAEEIFRSLIPRFETVSGINDWETTNCIDWLRGTLSETGKEPEAQELKREYDQRVRKREEEAETRAKAASQWEIENGEFVAEVLEQDSPSDSWGAVES
jgi:tetratricopeptide (TPR) repeat protein